MPFSYTIVRKVIEDGESLLMHNAQEDETIVPSASILVHDIRSVICVPIRSRARTIGAINADASGASLFTQDDLHLLTLIGNQAGTVIENAQLVDENIKAARLAAVGSTIAGLAHCIKNILQGLEGGTSVVDKGLGVGNMEAVMMAWPVIKDSQTRITQLVMNMLDYSKEREPAYAKADLYDHMKGIHDLMVDRAANTGVTVDFAFDEAMPQVECDPMAIYRATLNLVTNAIDAAQEGGGQVNLDVAPSDDLEYVFIRVRDNGPGIEEDVRPKLFEAFQSTMDSEGTGLGLAVSHKIATEHGGEILIDSEVGEGTSFIIKLPAKRPGKDGGPGASHSETIYGESIRCTASP